MPFSSDFKTKRHLISLRTLETDALIHIIKQALQLKRDFFSHTAEDHPQKRSLPLVGNLFFEASTRTKSSFEIAEQRLGLPSLSLATENSSLTKGESIIDTVLNLQAMGMAIAIVRHASSGMAEMIAQKSSLQVINAGDGQHEHPTQALLDIVTLAHHFGSIEALRGLTLLIVGDVRHSRVARSHLWAAQKLGIQIKLYGPPTLLPSDFRQLGATLCTSLEEGMAGADAIMALRIQKERMAQGFLPQESDYQAGFCLTPERIQALAPAHAVILHPGPINHGVEMASRTLALPQSLVLSQVENGVFTRMAALQWVMGAA